MYQIDFNSPSSAFFCGIGGISMSGLAEVLLKKGFKVSGSDMHSSALTDNLSKEGADIKIGQKAENVTSDADVFIYTAAIRKDHPEFLKAQELGIPMLTRAQLLGQMMKNYDMAIAVSGTHGKTTVTGMISEILLASDLDPTISIGGILGSINGNIRCGSSEYFLTEACEYTNSFLDFYPRASIILNIEADHLDFFKDLDDIRDSFRRFASLTPDNGIVIISNEIKDREFITSGTSCKVVSFGPEEGADYYPVSVSTDDKGYTHFTVKSSVLDAPEDQSRFTLMVPGFHNVKNALAAIAMADHLGIKREVTVKALAGYKGTDRRFEYKGTLEGVTIIDDYAHHPSEIRATLSAAKDRPHKKLYVAFQPHTYSRTKSFMDDFADALSKADEVVIADIYAAREKDNLGISGKDLADRISALGTTCYFIPDFEGIKKFVKENCTPGDMFITMGAGDIVNVANELMNL